MQIFVHFYRYLWSFCIFICIYQKKLYLCERKGFVMNMQTPNLYIIAGPNGAGKTTASFNLLPDVLHCQNFVNADEIARGLSPFARKKWLFKRDVLCFNALMSYCRKKLISPLRQPLQLVRTYNLFVARKHYDIRYT